MDVVEQGLQEENWETAGGVSRLTFRTAHGAWS